MQQILMPLLGAVIGGGVAYLVSGDLAPSIGAAVGVAIGMVIVQRRQAGTPK
ncbi:MAG TPA: hypothetical protein VEC11_14125 [Allosphingosinicella sp.]|nr:hypothetical protein [Allosphingosinicella sp.]